MMAKKGFRSITLAESIFDRYLEMYKLIRDELKEKGIFSFSGYMDYQLKTIIATKEILAKYPSIIDVILVEKELVVLKDHTVNRIIELTIMEGGKGGHLYCEFCKSERCRHVGFCYSQHQIYPIED